MALLRRALSSVGTPQVVDVAILGGGMVGAALAAALSEPPARPRRLSRGC